MEYPIAAPATYAGVLFAVCTIVLTSIAALAAEVEEPALRHGIWKLRKSVNQRPYESRQCMQPYEELLARHRQAADSGCTHEVTRKASDQWQISARCRKVNSEGRRWESDSLSVLTVSGETAYRLEVTGTTNGVPLRESVEGNWMGTCPRSTQ